MAPEGSELAKNLQRHAPVRARVGVRIERADPCGVRVGQHGEQRQQIQEICQSEFHLDSTQQLAVVLFDKWAVCKNMGLTYSGYDTWDRMLQQGIQLLERFARDGRVRVRRPQSNQQIQLTRTLSSGNNF